MLPINLLNALREYTLAQKPPLPTGAADTQPKAAPQLELGQKVQGIIQAQLAANMYKVSVAGQLIQMQLPASLRSGDTVPLQVISLQPRLAFGMDSSSTPIATPEQLGSTAKILSALSQQPPEKAYVRATQSTPLWEAPQPPESKQLAGMLRDALASSGLFYESHQAQWLEGLHSTAQLLLEPQNQSPERALAAAGAAGDGQVITANNVNKQTITDNAGNLTTTSDTARLPVSSQNQVTQPAVPEDVGKPARTTNESIAPSVTPGRTADADMPNPSNTLTTSPEGKAHEIPSHLQPLVQQQLNALETSQMLWQGNIWPGQEMQWEIHEQAPRPPSETGQRQWVTQIRLTLPNLGEVAATLRLNSAGLGLTLNAGNPQTRAMMGSASTQLVSALSDAGIPVVSTQITQ